MRRIVLLMIFTLCSGLPLIGLLGLAILWFGEMHALVLPNATDESLVQKQSTAYSRPLCTRYAPGGWSTQPGSIDPGNRLLSAAQ
jgi:hypothetical protein